MNDRQLNYFLVIAEEKNLGRAAAKLPLSLSALSRQMQSLEEELGAELFHRTGSGLELTRPGEILLTHARTLRAQFELTRREVQGAGDKILGKMDVGGFGAVSLIYIPQILKAFNDCHPDVEAVVHTGPATLQIDYLREGRTLAYFDRIHRTPPGCAAELAFHDNIVLAMPEDHPLAAKAEIPFEDLRDQPIIGRQDDRNYPPELHRLLASHDFQFHVVQRAQDMVTSATLAGCGLGIALVAASVQKLPIPKVAYRPLKLEQALNCDVYCIHREDDASPLLRALLHVVRAHRDDTDLGA